MRVQAAKTEAERHEARRSLLTVAAVARDLEVSDEHVRGLIADGDLTAMDVRRRGSARAEYRIRPEWLEAFKEARTSGTETSAA